MVATRAPNAAKARFELVEKLNEWVFQAGAWIVSPLGSNELRIECLTNSTLPQKLIDAGHKLTFGGTNERLCNSVVSEKKDSQGNVVLKRSAEV